MTTLKTKYVRTTVLDIAYEEWGLGNGHPLILLHGFPLDGSTDDSRYFTNLLETRILEGAGHFAHREKPEELIELLQD